MYGDWKSITEAAEAADPKRMAEAAPAMACALIGLMQAIKGTRLEETARVSLAMADEALRHAGLPPPD